MSPRGAYRAWGADDEKMTSVIDGGGLGSDFSFTFYRGAVGRASQEKIRSSTESLQVFRVCMKVRVPVWCLKIRVSRLREDEQMTVRGSTACNDLDDKQDQSDIDGANAPRGMKHARAFAGRITAERIVGSESKG